MGFFQSAGKGLKHFKDVLGFCHHAHWAFGPFVAPFVGAVVLAIISWYRESDLWLLPVSGFIGGSLVTSATGYILYAKFARPKLHNQSGQGSGSLSQIDQSHGYKRINSEYIYRIDTSDPKHHSLMITNRIEIVRPHVDVVRIRYMWTGDGRQTINVLSEGHTLLKPDVQQTGWSYHYVHLGDELVPGECVEINARLDLHDVETYEQVLAKTVSEPLESLVLRVVLPQNNPPTKVWNVVESGPRPCNQTIEKTPSSCDPHTGECRWSIEQPIIGRRYAIRWQS